MHVLVWGSRNASIKQGINYFSGYKFQSGFLAYCSEENNGGICLQFERKMSNASFHMFDARQSSAKIWEIHSSVVQQNRLTLDWIDRKSWN